MHFAGLSCTKSVYAASRERKCRRYELEGFILYDSIKDQNALCRSFSHNVKNLSARLAKRGNVHNQYETPKGQSRLHNSMLSSREVANVSKRLVKKRTVQNVTSRVSLLNDETATMPCPVLVAVLCGVKNCLPWMDNKRLSSSTYRTGTSSSA